MMLVLMFVILAFSNIGHSLHSTGCFSLPTHDCILNQFGVPLCKLSFDKMSKFTEVKILCSSTELIEILSVTYSIPGDAKYICDIRDKNETCSSSNPCFCCSKTSSLCSVTVNVGNHQIHKVCNNKTGGCTVNASSYQLTIKDCPGYETHIGTERKLVNCDTRKQQCISRWIDVEYLCHVDSNIPEPG